MGTALHTVATITIVRNAFIFVGKCNGIGAKFYVRYFDQKSTFLKVLAGPRVPSPPHFDPSVMSISFQSDFPHSDGGEEGGQGEEPFLS